MKQEPPKMTTTHHPKPNTSPSVCFRSNGSETAASIQVQSAPLQAVFDLHHQQQHVCKESTTTTTTLTITPSDELEAEEEVGRERLKRHRGEVAGRVWIPDMWGQEELLKDWIDCSAFDASLVPSGIMSARAALAEEGRRANSGGLRIENRC